MQVHRGLLDVQLEDLGRINIIVGINNAGKTSMLEAVYLLAHQADPRGLLEVVRRRMRLDGSADPASFADRLPDLASLSARFDLRDDGDTHVQIVCKDDPGTDVNIAEYLFGAPLDLSSFGEGLQRIFQIGLLFAGSRGGVVLIDEFENALHTTLLIELTRLIQELAVEMDVQLFLTTHSKEAVDIDIRRQ